MYIESQDELDSFVQRAASSSLLAIDTEFLREKTYYAKLCLLQIATDDEVVIIDPLVNLVARWVRQFREIVAQPFEATLLLQTPPHRRVDLGKIDHVFPCVLNLGVGQRPMRPIGEGIGLLDAHPA